MSDVFAMGNPTWSVMVPIYNCPEYLPGALESVLRQDPGAEQMQIEVVDDCSTIGDNEAIVREIGKGRVSYYRQPKNLGHFGNFNTCIERAQGRLLHLLHADDVVLPGFYEEMAKPFAEHPDLGAAFCRHQVIEANGNVKRIAPAESETEGIIDDFLFRIAVRQRIQYVTLVVRTDCYRLVGPFKRIKNAEDWEMYVRLAARFPFYYTPKVLACYRSHGQAMSSTVRGNAENIRDERRAIEEFNQYLPEAHRARLRHEALRFRRDWAMTLAKGFAGQRNFPAAWNQVKEGFKCEPGLGALVQSANVIMRMAYRGLVPRHGS